MNSTAEPILPPRPRGTLPDAETADRIYLVKNVSRLRATYQVRLLAGKAVATGKVLVLQLPRTCRFDPALRDFIRAAPHLIRREDLP